MVPPSPNIWEDIPVFPGRNDEEIREVDTTRLHGFSRSRLPHEIFFFQKRAVSSERYGSDPDTLALCSPKSERYLRLRSSSSRSRLYNMIVAGIYTSSHPGLSKCCARGQRLVRGGSHSSPPVISYSRIEFSFATTSRLPRSRILM